MWFIGVEVEEETSAPPPKKNPGSASGSFIVIKISTSVIRNKKTISLYITTG